MSPNCYNQFLLIKKQNEAKTITQYLKKSLQKRELLQNYLFPSRIDFHIKSGEKIQWHKLLAKNGLVGKGNTRIIISNEHAFYNSFERDGLHVSSVPQIILDLYNEGGVCVESGEMLMSKVITNAV